MIKALCLVLTALAVPSHEQQEVPISPCPNVFEYEPPGTEPGRWYGNVNLSTDSTLHSFWLIIELDRKADTLVNWIGDVTTTDNTEYIIKSTMMIHPGPAVVVRFYVQYGALNPLTPKLNAIRLNGREICNANNSQPALGRPDEGLVAPPYNLKSTPTPAPYAPVFNHPVNSSGSLDPVGFPGDLPTTIDTFTRGKRRPESLFEDKNNEQCGKVFFEKPNQLLLNGLPTYEGQWPWQIALYKTQTVDNKYICGGTLVSHLHVVTAAHCVTVKGSNRVTNKNTLTVYLGKHNLRTSVEGVQIKLVANIIKHPDYNASPYQRDLAILKLRERVTYTEWVQPACLWSAADTSLKSIVGKRGSVVGWGFDDTGVATEELNLVEMPVVDTETCIRSYSEFFARYTSEYTYCAGYKNGTSVCYGDSGGGMVFRINESWYLRGVVSLSLARKHDYSCDPSHYVIFTDVAKFLPWIQENISS